MDNMEIGVPAELRPGANVPIPCRHCQNALIPFVLAEGVSTVVCPRCGASTEVQVYAETGTWRVKTSPAPSKAPRR
jgi:hypothetical protein